MGILNFKLFLEKLIDFSFALLSNFFFRT